MLREFELIRRIYSKFRINTKTLIGIGDDCAVLKEKDKYYLYTIDSMIESVHFDVKLGVSWDDVGYKSVIRAISDVVAMGGIPKYILIALSMRKGFKEDFFQGLIKGVKNAIEEHNLKLIGGDISNSKTVSITVSVIGISKDKPVLRSGANIGDDIYLTGYTGLSSAGLVVLKKKLNFQGFEAFVNAYKKPAVKVKLGKALQKIATSMIDISDGLVGDLSHLLENSNKGAILYESNIPVHETFYNSPFSKKQIKGFIMNGGDDYELLFTASPEKIKDIERISKTFSVKITKIGEIVKKGLYLKEGQHLKALKSSSYEHVIG
jgi:thiamine-monophosphate kinase